MSSYPKRKESNTYRSSRPRKRRFHGNQYTGTQSTRTEDESATAKKPSHVNPEKDQQKSSGTILHNSDASKITSKGIGLKKAYLAKQNKFTVTATNAGNNVLYVGVYGPKGACEELIVKHKGRNNYDVSYLVKDKGEYHVYIKWGDDHIPGSPYEVHA